MKIPNEIQHHYKAQGVPINEQIVERVVRDCAKVCDKVALTVFKKGEVVQIDSGVGKTCAQAILARYGLE